MSEGPRRASAAPIGVRERYRAALESLYRRRRFGLKPGLEVEEALLRALGEPQRSFPSLHVTGSKGKGSVATLSAAILAGHGLRTALFTSPHLTSYRERLKIDDREASRQEVVDGLARVEALAEQLLAEGQIDRPPTFFEVTTALAFDWFARRGTQAAVVEVGLGGRLDATNLLDARVGVLTTIELEHTEILGPTLEAIALEKAGILHPGMLGVVGKLPGPAATAVLRVADRLGVPLWRLGVELGASDRRLDADGQSLTLRFPGLTLKGVRLPLLGTFQADNAVLAVAAAARFLEGIGRRLDPAATLEALATVRIPGRMQRLARAPELLYDVAHTPESARAVAMSVAEIAPLSDPAGSTVVFGCLQGKRVETILDALSPLARTLVIVPVRSERAMDTGLIRVAAVGRFPRVVLARSAGEGLALARAATAPDGVTLVTGSDYLVGELLRGNASEDEPDLSDPGTSVASVAAAPGPSGPGRRGP